jgi:thiosulfate/3-mercaptopyruvate sulfurtransferase
MKKTVSLLALLSLVSIVNLAAMACLKRQTAGAAKSVGVRSEMLVSTQWLAEHLKDPNVVVLHLADNVSDYKRGHIPGARYLAMKEIITDNGPISAELPTIDQLQKTFSELGVGDNSRVVIYATNWFPSAARAYFTLDYLGHGDKVALRMAVSNRLAEDRPPGDTPKFSPAHLRPRMRTSERDVEVKMT